MEDEEKKTPDYAAKRDEIETALEQEKENEKNAWDEISGIVNEYKAAQETPEQRNARVRQEKATAALSGVTEGIGNIFNLVNAATSKGAVSVGGGAPVTDKVAEGIKEGAAERKEADEKLRAMQERIGQLNMQRSRQNIERLMQERNYVNQREAAQKAEARAEELHDPALRTAKAQADAAEYGAMIAPEKWEEEKKNNASTRAVHAAQAEAANANADARRAKAEHSKMVSDVIKSSGSGYAKIDPTMTMAFDFGSGRVQGQLNDDQVESIFKMKEMQQFAKDAVDARLREKYGDGYSTSRDYQKNPSKYVLTQAERQQALRGALMQIINNGEEYYPDVVNAIKLQMGVSNGNNGSFWD